MNTNHLGSEKIAHAAEFQITDRYDELSKEIKSHLAECDDCANEVLMVGEIINEKTKTKKKIYRVSFAIAIAAALLILLTMTFFIPDNTTDLNTQEIAQIPEQKPTIEEPKDTFVSKTVPKENKNSKTAEKKTQKKSRVQLAYATHPRMEKLVERHNQGNLRSNNDITFQKEINLNKSSFIVVPKHEKLYLVEIYNNNGDLIKEINSEKDTVSIPELQKGLYYWKLINEDFDLVFVGKLKK